MYTRCYNILASSLRLVVIERGLMARKASLDVDSEKHVPIEELWQQVMLNPAFKYLFIAYTLEQLARHSALASIRAFCNYHEAHIPASEGEEEEHDSDANDSETSEWRTEKKVQKHTWSSDCKNLQSARNTKQISIFEKTRGAHALNGCYTVSHSTNASTPPEATDIGARKSKCARRT